MDVARKFEKQTQPSTLSCNFEVILKVESAEVHSNVSDAVQILHSQLTGVHDFSMKLSSCISLFPDLLKVLKDVNFSVSSHSMCC